MKPERFLLLSTAILGSMLQLARANEWDQKTVSTFSAPGEIREYTASVAHGLAETAHDALADRNVSVVAAALKTAYEGDLSMAKAVLLRHLAQRDQSSVVGNEVYVKVFSQIASLYNLRGDYNEALELFQLAVDILESAGDTDSLELSNALSSVSATLSLLHRYTEAEPLMARALSIVDASAKASPELKARALTNLANLHLNLALTASAIPLYLKAVSILECGSRSADEQLADVLSNLGEAYLRRNSMLKADQVLRRSIATAEAALGPDDVALSCSLSRLGGVQYTLGYYEAAEKLYERSIRIGERITGPEEATVAITRANLGALRARTRGPEAAEPLLRQAVATFERLLPNDPMTALLFVNLAEIHTVQQQYRKALALLERAVKIHARAPKTDGDGLRNALQRLAECLISLGNYPGAEEHYRRLIGIEEESLGSSHPDHALTLQRYAWLLRKLDRKPEALVLERQARTLLVGYQ